MHHHDRTTTKNRDSREPAHRGFARGMYAHHNSGHHDESIVPEASDCPGAVAANLMNFTLQISNRSDAFGGSPLPATPTAGVFVGSSDIHKMPKVLSVG